MLVARITDSSSCHPLTGTSEHPIWQVEITQDCDGKKWLRLLRVYFNAEHEPCIFQNAVLKGGSPIEWNPVVCGLHFDWNQLFMRFYMKVSIVWHFKLHYVVLENIALIIKFLLSCNTINFEPVFLTLRSGLNKREKGNTNIWLTVALCIL